MAKILNPLMNNQFVSQYAPLPVQAVDALGDKLETTYYGNVDAANQLEAKLAALKVRDVNSPILQEQMTTLQADLDSYRKEGNWENASMAVRDTAQKVATNQKLRGALEDKAAYDAWLGELQKGVQDGTFDKEQFDYYVNEGVANNQSPIEVDPTTGVVNNIFSFGKPTKNMDAEIRTTLTELGKSWKSDTIDNPIQVTYRGKDGKNVTSSIMYRTGSTGSPPGYYDVQQKKYIDESEVRSAMMNAILSDTKYKTFVEESAKIQTWKASKANGGVFTIDDLVNPANPNAVFTPEQFAELEQQLAAQNVDVETMLDDPEMMEALYMLGSRNKKLDGMVDAPARATSFTEISHTFLADIEFAEALKLRNELAKIKAKGNEDRKTKKYEMDFQAAQQLVVKNRGPVTDGSTPNFGDIAVSVEDKKRELDNVKAEIERHQKAGTNPSNISALYQKQKELETQVAVQQHQIIGNASAYLDTPEGSKFLREQYNKFLETQPQFAASVPTIEEFKKSVLQPTGRRRGLVSRVFGYTQDLLSGNSPQYLPNDIVYATHDKVLAKTTKAAEAGELPGLSGFTYDNEDLGNKSAIYRVANETKTAAYLANKTGYYIPNGNGGTMSAVQWEQAFRDKHPDAQLEFKVTTSDADHSTGGVALFPDKIAVVDKKTGKTLNETWIYPIDGGADEMLQIGRRGRQNFAPGTAEHADATRMAALATFTPLVTADLELASSHVKPGSGQTWRGEPVEVAGPVGSVRVVPIRTDQAYYDNKTGAKKGNDAVWMLGFANEKGEVVDYLPNMTYFNSDGTVNTNAVSSNANAYQFKTLTDAKVAAYEMIADDAPRQGTRYLSEETEVTKSRTYEKN